MDTNEYKLMVVVLDRISVWTPVGKTKYCPNMENWICSFSIRFTVPISRRNISIRHNAIGILHILYSQYYICNSKTNLLLIKLCPLNDIFWSLLLKWLHTQELKKKRANEYNIFQFMYRLYIESSKYPHKENVLRITVYTPCPLTATHRQ